MKIKCLRIQYEENMDDCKYTLFDRYGNFHQVMSKAICIENLPKVKYFGFCPNGTVDVTLDFEEPIDSKIIKVNY